MSAIDSYNHAHVANFYGLPVYWFLEDIDKSNITDFKSDEGQILNKGFLSIGGGSGEHPALIVDIQKIILKFISNVNEIEKPDIMDIKEISYDYEGFKLAKILEKRFEEYNYYRLDQNEWPIETFIKIATKMNAKEKKYSIQEAMLNSIATFCIFEMPHPECIDDLDVVVFAQMIKSNNLSKLFNREKLSLNGFAGVWDCQKGGKIIKDGKVVWGYSLNDWKKDNEIIKANKKFNF